MSMGGTYGTPSASTVPGSPQTQRMLPPQVVGGIDNGMYPGAQEGARVLGGSSGGVAAGPPGGIANNQMDRISR